MSLKSLGQSLATLARHVVPVGGLFGRDWHPVTALAVYWLESLLLAASASLLCVLINRRVSAASIDEARRAGDREDVGALQAERDAVLRANIKPGEVFAFHIGSMMIFGCFFAGVLIVVVGNGHIAEPVRWGELGEGTQVMAAVIAIGLLFDVWRFDRMGVGAVESRVNACLARWGLLWLLGFFGTLVMMMTGRAAVFFGFFAVLKIVFESWAWLARLLGWQSMKDRATAADNRTR